MTLVNAETGEVATDGDLTAEEAELLLSQTLAAAEMTVAGVTRLYLGRAWIALGFESWDDLCEKRASHLRMMRWPREERQEIVASLRESGLSTRAIAAVTGDSEATVRRDLSGASNDAPAPAPVDAPWTPDIADVPEPEEVAKVTITGTDGKTYDAKKVNKDKTPRPERVQQIEKLAAQGYTSRQIADLIGVGWAHVRNIVNAEGITIAADDVRGRARNVDSNRVVAETVDALDGLVIGLGLVDFADLDPERVEQWASSLRSSLRSINRFTKELTQ